MSRQRGARGIVALKYGKVGCCFAWAYSTLTRNAIASGLMDTLSKQRGAGCRTFSRFRKNVLERKPKAGRISGIPADFRGCYPVYSPDLARGVLRLASHDPWRLALDCLQYCRSCQPFRSPIRFRNRNLTLCPRLSDRGREKLPDTSRVALDPRGPYDLGLPCPAVHDATQTGPPLPACPLTCESEPLGSEPP